MMRCCDAVTVCWLVLVLAGASVSAQNLVSNPYFDSGVAGWDVYEPGNGILLWSNSMDAGGSAVTGSASVGILPTLNYVNFGIDQCVAVEAGEHYRFGASYHLSIDSGTQGRAQTVTTWFEGTGCTGNAPWNDSGNVLGIGSVGTWQVSENPGAESPVAARSARFILLINKTSGGGIVSAYIDRAFFERTSVFADGFEGGDTTAWASSSG